MVGGVTELNVDGAYSLEVMTDVQLVAHAHAAVQLHGGMGMSDELNVGHYFKRISSINEQFGDPAYHLMRYAQQN